jgi:hypothetical protein
MSRPLRPKQIDDVLYLSLPTHPRPALCIPVPLGFPLPDSA